MEENAPMKAISLWQPWASAMASGIKQNETRSWPTSYRGDLVICSAKRKPTPEEVGERETYETALALPYGCALCVVELFDCLPTERFTTQTSGADSFIMLSETEADLGNYMPGRFAWRTRNCRELKRPVPLRGYQGIWNLDESAEAAVLAMLNTATVRPNSGGTK
jgi:hypothetical protein